MAYNLFQNHPSCTFESTFDSVFAASIYDHALHIYQNLERLPLRANHYLANIVSLLFASASLPDTQEVQTWYTFASTQLASSMGEQFTHDGANFEGSTSYHRLSAEMAVYGVALVLGIESIHSDASSPLRLQSPLRIPRSHVSRSLVSARHFELLERMAEFSIDITEPSVVFTRSGITTAGGFWRSNRLFAGSSARTPLTPLRAAGNGRLCPRADRGKRIIWIIATSSRRSMTCSIGRTSDFSPVRGDGLRHRPDARRRRAGAVISQWTARHHFWGASHLPLCQHPVVQVAALCRPGQSS